MDVYANEGRYAEAMQTSGDLLQSLKSSFPSAQHSSPDAGSDQTVPEQISREEVVVQQQSFQVLLQKEAHIQSLLASTQDPAAILALHGTLDENRLHTQEAMGEFRAAYRRLAQEPQAAPKVRRLVETLFLTHLNSIDGLTPNDRKQVRALYARHTLENPNADLADQRLALGFLSTLFFEPALRFTTDTIAPLPAEVTELKKSLDVFTAAPVPAGSAGGTETNIQKLETERVDLHHQVDNLRRQLTEREINALLSTAATAEKASRWSAAADAYQTVIQRANENTDPTEQSVSIDQMVLEARRSLPIMKSMDRLSADTALQNKNGFLGIDYTVGPKWTGTLGTEGWVLFAPHGDDLCGGMCILDKTFSYRAYLGDPANTARRWRDPVGPLRYPGSDLPLDDPAVPGEGVVSYLDDNGENYPVASGPDLYVKLTIPPGKHFLSLPLHFDLGVPKACYSFYLLSGDAAGAAGDEEVHCLSAKIVSTIDEPGYIRLAVAGPAQYTLLVRRLTSENANLPALFLDPDLRDVRPPSLSAELPGASRLASDSLASSTSLTNSETAFQEMTTEYGAGAGSTSSPTVSSETASTDWSSLNKTATVLSSDATLTSEQQLVAALVAWRSEERLPLQAGKLNSTFSRFLALRFPQAVFPSLQQPPALPAPQEGALRVQLSDLSSLSQQLRLLGRVPLAEMADDAAWNTQVQLALLASPTDLATNKQQQNTLLKQLWQAGPSQYLADQTVWIWRGSEGPAPQPIFLALDAGYAARKAGLVVGALVAAEPMIAMLAKASSTSANSAPIPPAASVGVQPAEIKVEVSAKDNSNTKSTPGHIAAGKTTALPDSVSLQLARIRVDEFKSNMLTRQSQPDGALHQPTDLIVYIGACQPLLEPSPGRSNGGQKEDDVQESDKAPLYSASLLRSDQMQSLANALINRDLFPSERQAQERAEAVKLLKTILVQDPHYAQTSEVNATLAFLEPAAQPAK